MQVSTYASNLKWLAISFSRLVKEVENWAKVLAYFMAPIHKSSLRILFKSGDILTVPRDYVFEAIAETLLLNVYDFKDMPSGAVVVDIGASVGDFTLLASKNPDVRVYAFEPSRQSFRFMQANVTSNGRRTVRLFNALADGHTLGSIFSIYSESKIDFLKVDCEGCEYSVLLECPQSVLRSVKRIAMEIHEANGRLKGELITHLGRSGFRIFERKSFGHGHYVYAIRGA